MARRGSSLFRAMRQILTLSLWRAASAGESGGSGTLGNILQNISQFDPLQPAAHETHIHVGVYFERLHKVDDVAHTFDAEFFLIYKWYDPRDYSELFRHNELLERVPVTCIGDSVGAGGDEEGGHRILRE